MAEPEIAAAYRLRFTEVANRAERLETVENEVIGGHFREQSRVRARRGEDSFPPEQPLALVTLVPDIPGQMSVDAVTYAEFQHALTEPIVIGGLGPGPLTASVAPRRLVAALGGASRSMYAELHTDGSGSFLWPLPADPPTTAVACETIIEVLLSALPFLAHHARDRTGAGGSAHVRLRLTASRVALAKFTPLKVSLACGGTDLSDVAVDQAVGEVGAVLDHLADGGADLVSAADLLASDLVHAFGLVDFPLLSRDGSLAQGKWTMSFPHLYQWAVNSGIDVR
ncbi:hypothetical protein ACWEJ6_46785 [Nonomuraea sp. NPDC004702]